MAVEELLVYQKTIDFFVWERPVIRHLAKVHRYSLGVQIETRTLELLERIIEANYVREGKAERIERCLVSLEVLKALVRAGHEARNDGGISAKHYETASVRLLEIGRLLSAWRKRFAEPIHTGARLTPNIASGG